MAGREYMMRVKAIMTDGDSHEMEELDLAGTGLCFLIRFGVQQVLLRIGFCLLVAPDAGSPFLGHFQCNGYHPF
eukprot:scaffold21816_cov129-Amphora_coffeaeformis.AAC.1